MSARDWDMIVSALRHYAETGEDMDERESEEARELADKIEREQCQ